MTIENNSKPMGCSKSSSKREAYSNTSTPQENRKTSNKQFNLTLRATRKRATPSSPRQVSKRK